MIVFNKSIVNKSDTLFLIIMRVGIEVCLITMGRPSGMPKAYAVLVAGSTLQVHPLYAVSSESIRRGEFCANELPILIDRHYTARVIPS
jgi:hypothetical protein